MKIIKMPKKDLNRIEKFFLSYIKNNQYYSFRLTPTPYENECKENDLKRKRKYIKISNQLNQYNITHVFVSKEKKNTSIKYFQSTNLGAVLPSNRIQIILQPKEE